MVGYVRSGQQCVEKREKTVAYDVHEIRVTASIPHDTRKDRHREAPRLLSWAPYLMGDYIARHFGR